MNLLTVTAAKIEAADIDFATPPECQGQIVTYSYGLLPDGHGDGFVIERRHDQSDGSVSYGIRHLEEDDEEIDPQNGAPGGEFFEVDE